MLQIGMYIGSKYIQGKTWMTPVTLGCAPEYVWIQCQGYHVDSNYSQIITTLVHVCTLHCITWRIIAVGQYGPIEKTSLKI